MTNRKICQNTMPDAFPTFAPNFPGGQDASSHSMLAVTKRNDCFWTLIFQLRKIMGFLFSLYFKSKSSEGS